MRTTDSAQSMVTDSQHTRNQIIEAFLHAGDQFVSGTDLSTQVGISRTAIWKHVQALEEMGFEFESVTRLGHRLTRVPNLLIEPLLRQYLTKGSALGQHVIWQQSVASTNIVAAKLARQGIPHGTIITAQEQTGGRGRRGKAWFSPPSGLWFSIVLNRPLPLRRAAELTLLTSVAVRRALREQTNLPVQIKWPNDLLLHNKKTCGILAEIRADGENVQHAVVGIGINTNIPKEDFPEDVQSIATSFVAEGATPLSHAVLVADILKHLEPMYDSLVRSEAGFLAVIDEWREACATLGNPVRIQTPTGLLEGVAMDIDESGVLYVKQPDGTTTPVHSGDILF